MRSTDETRPTMRHTAWIVALAAAAAFHVPRTADAHFVWLAVASGSVRVYFNETPDPGDADLVANSVSMIEMSGGIFGAVGTTARVVEAYAREEGERA